MSSPESPRRPLHPAAACLLAATTLAAAYGQAPLYYSNQNQYFLHGLAQAGLGGLAHDWLAGTLDPTPVFSALVAGTVIFLHPGVFHLYHGVLVGAYASALLGLFETIVGRQWAERRWWVFVALMVLVHSALARWSSYRLLGQDYPWYFQAGVAGQYVLGAMFQPSVFGVLLIVAVALLVRGQLWLAAFCVAAACTMHATYLLPGALLTLGFVTALLCQHRPRQALSLAGLTLLLVLPVTLYAIFTFGPTTTDTFAEAQDILVNLRMPHHARMDLWLDEIAGLQIVWVILAIAMTWRTPLCWILSVPFVLAILLTAVQAATGSHGLALLFPWRISAILMPIATAIILAHLACLPLTGREELAARFLAVVILLVLMVGGIWISAGRLAFHSADEERPLLDFVQRCRQPGDLYFLPVRIPNLAATTRGSLSSDFKPLPAKRRDTRIIPVDLQRFRLHTGAPIFVDFKAIPYKDTDVIEWRDRLILAQSVLEQLHKGRLKEALASLRRRGVTHLVLPATLDLSSAELLLLYLDSHYRVYRLAQGR